MNLLNAKAIISASAISFIIGILTMLLCINSCHESARHLQPTTILRKQSEASKKYYDGQVVVLKKRNMELQNKIDALNRKLTQSKTKTSAREQRIGQLVKPKGFLAKDLLQKTRQVSPVSSSDTPVNCDSLITEVSAYMLENKEKDSIYEQKIILQDSIIAVKDSVISLQNNFINDQQQIIATSLETQGRISKENDLLRKKIKRRKFSNKLAVIGATIASTLTTLLITANR